jgi:hypothetical protein
MAWLRASLIVQVILALYFQVIIWFPLGSWNDQPGQRLVTLVQNGQAIPAVGFALTMLLPVMLFALAFWRRWLWLMWLGLIGYGTWAALQIQSWWIPWIFGADERTLNNAKFLERTYKLFSSSPAHPAPDGMHFVLDLLLFASVATIAIGLLSIKGSARAKKS